jgi:hypothetical protein
MIRQRPLPISSTTLSALENYVAGLDREAFGADVLRRDAVEPLVNDNYFYQMGSFGSIANLASRIKNRGLIYGRVSL